jgi:hypothetical protein
MGENPASKRDYKREYELWLKRPNAMKDHSARVKARRAAVKEYGKAYLQGKDVDHIEPLRDPGTNNSPSNWRVVSSRANRSWRKGKKGYD